jgi:hypothetical protein
MSSEAPVSAVRAELARGSRQYETRKLPTMKRLNSNPASARRSDISSNV